MDEKKQNTFSFEKKQLRIYELLRLIGPGPASFYKDACRLISGDIEFESGSHIIGHLLREIESAICDILLTYQQKNEIERCESNKKHKLKIHKATAMLGLSEDDPTTRAWLALNNKNKGYALHSLAHRTNFDSPRSISTEVISAWDKTESLFLSILELLESNYLKKHDYLDSLLSIQNPSKKDIDALVKHCPNNFISRQYFFSKLENYKWLELLARKGLFKTPPESIINSETDYKEYPPWPESQYLSRMAPVVPREVLNIILEMENTDNYIVHRNLLNAILSMPPEISAQSVSKVISWIDAPSVRWYPDGYAKLIRHLLNGNQVDVSLELAEALFDLSEVEEEKSAKINDTYFRKELKPISKFDDFWYKEYLEQIALLLTEKAGLTTLGLFNRILENAILLTEDSEGEHKYYYAGPPAIEDHEQNQFRDDPIDVLIFTVRKIAEKLIGEHTTKVLVKIENHDYIVFTRIGLHLRWIYSDIDIERTKILLSTYEIIENENLYHELTNLFQKYYGILTIDEQAVYLKYIEDGIDKEVTAKNYKTLWGESLSKKELDEKERYWQYRQLYRIKEYINLLPEKWQSFYHENNVTFGDLEHPEFISYTSSKIGFGYKTPKSKEQLSQLSVDDLIGYLRKLDITENNYDDVVEGMGIELKELVLENINKYASESKKFMGLYPPFISGLLDGIQQAIKNNSEFETQLWKPVLDLCLWVIKQPRDEQIQKGHYREHNPGWGWTRKDIVDLLSEGFISNTARIPYDFKDDAWSILSELTDDPEPQPKTGEQGKITELRKPTDEALNTVRGRAMHALINYAWWVRGYVELQPNGKEELSKGLDLVPEVRGVLDKHLNPDIDSSLAIRSFYGQFLPWLIQLDKKWVIQNRENIFPREQNLVDFRLTAWMSYIEFNRAYSDIYEILKDEYIYAVDNIGQWDPRESRLNHPDKNLAVHLIFYYWRGFIQLDDPKELIPRLYDKASDDIRAHVIRIIGEALRPNEEQNMTRLQVLWEKRIQNAKEADNPNTYRKELSAFGYWFLHINTIDRWMIEQLVNVLEITHTIERSKIVLERIESISTEYPLEIVHCVELLVDGMENDWDISYVRENLRNILSSVINSENDDAKGKAINLVHKIGSKGYLDFRELIP